MKKKAIVLGVVVALNFAALGVFALGDNQSVAQEQQVRGLSITDGSNKKSIPVPICTPCPKGQKCLMKVCK